jgi:hypothetical protein
LAQIKLTTLKIWLFAAGGSTVKARRWVDTVGNEKASNRGELSFHGVAGFSFSMRFSRSSRSVFAKPDSTLEIIRYTVVARNGSHQEWI